MIHNFIVVCDSSFLNRENSLIEIGDLFVKDLLRLTKDSDPETYKSICSIQEDKTSYLFFINNLYKNIEHHVSNSGHEVFWLKFDFSS